jgi:hypothetical protein
MKSVYWLIFALPFLMTCLKEDRETVYNVSGSFKDGSTGNPIKGVSWAVYTADGDANAAWNGELVVEVHVSGVTKDDGTFDASFNNFEPNLNNVYLGSTAWPERYQRYVRYDNDNGIKNLYLDINDFYTTAASELLNLRDDQHYALKMYPKASYKIVLPSIIPNEFKQDTLVLNLLTTHQVYWEDNRYALGNINDILRLQNEERNVIASDKALGWYTLRNGTVKKEGYFDVYCDPGVITEVHLSF